jgi:hypothetical protein
MNACCIFPNFSFSDEQLAGDTHIVPIDEEPNHCQVLTSNELRVFDVRFLPGKRSLWHSHQRDSVMICLDGADVPSEEPGKALVHRPPIESGKIYYKPYAKHPFVHRIRNTSETPFRILDIEILTAESKFTELKPLPEFAFLVLENDRVRVSKFALPPGKGVETWHLQGAGLLVAMNAGQIEGGSHLQSESLNAKGGLHLQEGQVGFALRNNGDALKKLVLIEVK